ncbi:MAG: zinc metalloprotease HtpX [Candidatus Sumerlaeales bacterium]|nr:zinc metalloprotease HtpX [Candidatus Sumerlaeales bacterium]
MGNQFKTYFLMVALIAIITGFGAIVDSALGGNHVILFAFFLFSLISTWVTYWYADTIVLKMYRGKIVSREEEPELHEIVERLAVNAHIPMPRIAIVPMAEPNAFATGRNPQHGLVACTTGILNILDKQELAGVLGHEIGHIKHRDTLLQTIAATLTGILGMLASVAKWGTIFGDNRNSNPIALVVMLIGAILLPFVGMLISMAISRSREYLADSAGAEFSRDPNSLARALQKMENMATASAQHGLKSNAIQGTEAMFIINPFAGASLASLFSTHPPTEKRIARLQQMAMGRQVF